MCDVSELGDGARVEPHLAGTTYVMIVFLLGDSRHLTTRISSLFCRIIHQPSSLWLCSSLSYYPTSWLRVQTSVSSSLRNYTDDQDSESQMPYKVTRLPSAFRSERKSLPARSHAIWMFYLPRFERESSRWLWKRVNRESYWQIAS
jgi:hypothetical protein